MSCKEKSEIAVKLLTSKQSIESLAKQHKVKEVEILNWVEKIQDNAEKILCEERKPASDMDEKLRYIPDLIILVVSLMLYGVLYVIAPIKRFLRKTRKLSRKLWLIPKILMNVEYPIVTAFYKIIGFSRALMSTYLSRFLEDSVKNTISYMLYVLFLVFVLYISQKISVEATFGALQEVISIDLQTFEAMIETLKKVISGAPAGLPS